MLVKSAVRFNGEIYIGTRHGCIIQDIVKEFPDARIHNQFDQGFVDENDIYYNRIDAVTYAKQCGQLPNNFSRNKLFSEDLW
jgi:hypothetical protein